MTWRFHEGDVIETLRAYPDNHFDGAQTDPPYGLSKPLTSAEMTACLLAWAFGQPYRPRRQGGFQGKRWDAFLPGPEVWRELYRVLKPGAHAFVFAGPRTRGLMEVALTLSGFEVLDAAAWLFSTGAPLKNMNLDLAIDGHLGAKGDRPVVGYQRTNVGLTGGNYGNGGRSGEVPITAPATETAQRFEGYGTALKPGFEPAILVMKPNEGTYAQNALLHNVAGLNLAGAKLDGDRQMPNVMLDEQLALQLGDAARFFYVAKASRAERDAGCDELPDVTRNRCNPGGLEADPKWAPREVKNAHPCVKPIALTRQLATLLLPPKREHDVRRLVVPFSGSGSEAIGGLLAGWDDITGIELDPEHCRVADARMRHHEHEIRPLPKRDVEDRPA